MRFFCYIFRHMGIGLLIILNISDTYIDNLDTDWLVNLQFLDISLTPISHLTTRGLIELIFIALGCSSISFLDLTSLPKL